MGFKQDLAGLRRALDECGSLFVYRPQESVPPILNALAGLLEMAPADSPLCRILEPILKAFPSAPLAAGELRRLAEAAGHGQDTSLLIAAGQAAKALRELAKRLTNLREPNILDGEIRLRNEAERFLSRLRCKLVLFLLDKDGRAAHERDVIAHLWPKETRRKAPSPRARNRLFKLEHDTNEALLQFGGSYKVRREDDRVLRLVRRGV